MATGWSGGRMADWEEDLQEEAETLAYDVLDAMVDDGEELPDADDEETLIAIGIEACEEAGLFQKVSDNLRGAAVTDDDREWLGSAFAREFINALHNHYNSED